MNLKREITAFDAFVVKLIVILELFFLENEKILGKDNAAGFILNRGLNVELKEQDLCYDVTIKPIQWPKGNSIWTRIFKNNGYYSLEEVHFFTPDISGIDGKALKVSAFTLARTKGFYFHFE